MKKVLQQKINDVVKAVYEDVKCDIENYRFYHGRRLRSCSATVINGDYGYYLKSYNTIVAYIPYNERVCYDFLRYVYGYTATSAQHISKFAHDYGADEGIKSFKYC